MSTTKYQLTLVIIKPGIMERGIVGSIITRFEAKKLYIHASKVITFTKDLAQQHYHEHIAKPFFPDIEEYICSSPVLLLVLGGYDAITGVRRLVGATRVEDTTPGSIRGDFAISALENVIHASDSPENAQAEISRFFSENEIVSAPYPSG